MPLLPEVCALDASRIPVLERDAGWTLELLLASPDIVPRHFPADRHGPPGLRVDATEFRRHPRGAVGYLDDNTRSWCPQVASKVLESYRTLLWMSGLTVDHHGWLYSDRAKGDWPCRSVARLRPVMPRVVRCLSLLELRGYSASGYRDAHHYGYAAGLAAKLIELLDLRDDGSPLSTECKAVLGPT